MSRAATAGCKAIAVTCWAAAMAAWFVMAHEEGVVLAEQRHDASAEASVPLEIKGQVFFVTADERLRYVAGRDVFIGGILGFLLAVAAGIKMVTPR